MITGSSIASIEWLYERAIGENSVADGEGACEMKRLPAGEVFPSAGRHLVVLTIASYAFRIVALFNFARDDATKAHMARLVRSADAAIDGHALDDAYAELVNMICGTVNRSLVDHFPHIGMSTPFVLESTCGRHLEILDPTHLQSYRISAGDAFAYYLTLCLCAPGDRKLDFHVERRAPEISSSGELEMF